jgi:hypothetical protein
VNGASTHQPQTAAAFDDEASRLGREGKDRELLAFADRFGKAFLDHLTADQWSRLDGLLESAQMAVDLEVWSAAPTGQRPATDAAPAARPNAVETAAH